MAISPEDALQVATEQRRRLGQLRRRAARQGSETPPSVLVEIAELEAALADKDESPDVPPWNQDEAMPHDPVSRYEFAMLATQVARITQVLILSTIALVLSLTSFLLVIYLLVSR